jgi:hypothetical protein
MALVEVGLPGFDYDVLLESAHAILPRGHRGSFVDRPGGAAG